jgi:arylsulfatase A-like enzyme
MKSFVAMWVVLTGLTVAMAADPDKPNVVFILTDNHGPWTLGCYGNEEIRTPNIDRLADEGMLFTRCFSSNAVCSPTRATYLTGLMPSQHGVHCYLAGGGAQTGPNAYYTLEEFDTLPEYFSRSGYACGLTGKWHLGGNLKPQDGFTYWITKPHGHTTTFYDAEIIENGEIRKEPTYLTEFWTDHAIKFIEQNKERPFFLFLAYNGPYGLGGHLRNPARNRHAAYYADKELKSFPREPAHEWLRQNREFVGNMVSIRRYAAEVSGVDDGVGQVMDTLKKHGLAEDTLVIFTADQGLSGGHHGMWGMGDHSRPLHAFDGTMHIPLIYRWPGRIPAGKRSDIMVSNYDFMPTVLNLFGHGDWMPKKPESPGRDYSPTLHGKEQAWDNVVFYEYENTRAVRTDMWKLILRYPDGPNELYHLADDPEERKNLYDDASFSEQRSLLDRQLTEYFERYADPKYDLWKDGGSKSIVLTFDKSRKLPPPPGN